MNGDEDGEGPGAVGTRRVQGSWKWGQGRCRDHGDKDNGVGWPRARGQRGDCFSGAGWLRVGSGCIPLPRGRLSRLLRAPGSHPDQEAHQDQIPAARLQLDGAETQPDQRDGVQRAGRRAGAGGEPGATAARRKSGWWRGDAGGTAEPPKIPPRTWTWSVSRSSSRPRRRARRSTWCAPRTRRRTKPPAR